MGFGQNSKDILGVERVANDLRKNFPVIIDGKDGSILVAASENISEKALSYFKGGCDSDSGAKILFTANRAKYLSGEIDLEVISSVQLNDKDSEEVGFLASGFKAVGTVEKSNFSKADELETSAVTLTKIAELLPSAVVAKIDQSFDRSDFLSIDAEKIRKYKDLISYELTESCAVNLPTKYSEQGRVIAYRPNVGGMEHYAIIVGNPGENPLIRVHSSCYTGDLLESLACDCHDQLHHALKIMGEGEGGIVLYMLQEGRGIGLVNKFRAYHMKENGLDTLEANEALGFDDDERLFLPAVKILQKLSIDKVRLLTNNPKKAAGLEEYGIKVSELVAHVVGSNEHSKDYLMTKAEKMGHKNL